MDVALELEPFLTSPPADAAPGAIAVVMTGDLCLSFRPPPWSTKDDITRTSVMLSRTQSNPEIWYSYTPMDPNPDGHSNFRFARRQDADDIWRTTYRCDEGRLGVTKNDNQTVLHEDASGSLFFVYADEFFGGPKTCFRASRELVVGDRTVSLSLVQWFDKFDVNDESKWPLSRTDAIAHCKHLNKLKAHPQT